MALPLLLLFIYYAGPAWFTGFVTLATAIGLYEFYAMSLPQGRELEVRLALIGGSALVPLAWGFGPLGLQIGLTVAVFGFAILLLFRFQDLKQVVHDLSLLLLGLLYVPLLLGHLALLHQLPWGREWVFLVLLIVMAGDTGAYFTGVSIGCRKLYPAISPNKSIEGALGGLVGSLLGALLAKFWFFAALGYFDCVILGLGLGVLGQLGDLFESMLKRSFGVKDSGALIPGHGGILDRLDSLVFAFPPAYYYALICFAH